ENLPSGSIVRDVVDNVADRHAEIIKDVAAFRVGAIELARTVIGNGFSGNSQQLISRAMMTSDFPLILSGAASASLRQGYENEPATHREWVGIDFVKDFAVQERPLLGSAPDLKLKLEHGEYEQSGMDEDAA